MAVTPVAGGAALTALPSAVQDLARFFLSLSGSSSLGAVSGIAGVTASTAGSGGAVCPPTDAGGAVTTCTATVAPAGAGVSPAAPAAVPCVSGEQQRRVESRSRRCSSRSFSDGADRRAKKRARRRSPSPGPSSRRRGRRYRSSSDSSEEDRADASPPRSGRAHGGTPGGTRSSRAYDRSTRPGTSRSYARDDRYRSGAGRRSPAPSGASDDDRSSAFESVDFDRDDSFRSVLGLIRSFLGMEEPAGVPSARCKTSLTSAYGLMLEVSPAFTLPASPLVRSLLDDTNLAFAKFLEDQTVHGFLPVPGRRHRRYYRTFSSSFPGPYTVPPGVTSITLEKVSEAKKRALALSASQVSSMEAMLSVVCEVSSWLDWWLSTCGGFRDHLPVEVRADFERLMISGSRALEFLASQCCTTLGNLVLARRGSLLADVRSTVPAEEVARLRYSPLPETAPLFPHPLLDSALLKMRAAASDALVQRTLHPPRFLGNLRRLVSQADPRLLLLARRAPLVLARLRSSHLVLLPRVSLARGRRKVKARLPFPLPPEASAALEEKVKAPGKNQPDGVTLPVRVGGCLAQHWRQWQAVGAETWVVTVLRDGYRILFKDSPPPLSRTPVSFPTYRQALLGLRPCGKRSRGCLPKEPWKSPEIRVPAFTVAFSWWRRRLAAGDP